MSKVQRVQLFQPRKRVAVLINSHLGTRSLRLEEGNCLIYGMEAALRRGYPNLTQATMQYLRGLSPKARKAKAESAIQKAKEMYVSDYQDFSPSTSFPPFQDRQRLSLPQRLATIFCYSQAHECAQTAAGHSYDAIHVIGTGKDDPHGTERKGNDKDQCDDTLFSLRGMSDEHSLTVVLMSGHGTGFITGIILYSGLLKRLDSIPGKKVIFNFSCHAGGLLDHIKKTRRPSDYLTICSSGAKEKSWPRNDQWLLEDIVNHILANRPLGEFECSRYGHFNEFEQTPVMHKGFDVVI